MSKSVSFGSTLFCLALIGSLENLGIIPQINPPSVLAQPIVPATDGTNTEILPNVNQFDIQGGQFSEDGTNLFHSFQRFGLSEGQIANFLSNPNIRNIIGRINGGEASLINGLIQVTGGNSNLYLMNPAGIVFGANAQLNVPAAFTATSATGIGFDNNNWFNAVGDNNWLSLVGTPNQFRFDALNPGSIVNFGNLAVGTGESLTLLGGSTINLGTLEAPGGRITVAAVPGKNLVRISQEGRLLSVELLLIPEGERQPEIIPLSLPQLLTGANVGNANTISVNEKGQVVLTGSGISVPNVGGTTIVSGSISSRSQQLVGGELNILGSRIALLNANIDASGANGGGNIFIGGNRSGLGSLPNAQYTFVSSNSVVSADALQQGNGGEIIVFAEDTAQVHGKLTARGGLLGGNGGFIETSGMRSLTITSVPNVGATAGLGGEWLIDPSNITIVAGNGNTNISKTSPFEPSDNNAQIGVDLITAALNSGDVTISTSSDGTQAGDITLSTPLRFNLTSERTLTLNADNDIFINEAIQPAGASSAPLNLVLNGNKGDLGADVGRVIFNGGIGNSNTLGGNISIRGRSNSSSGVEISEHLNSGGGDINIIGVSVTQNGSQGVVFNGEISSGGGNISITGDSFNSQGIFRNILSAGNISIDSGGGNITFNGTSNLRDGIRLTLGVINSGGGNITFNGTSNIFDGIRFGLVSINAEEGNITLNGTSTNLDNLPFNDPNVVSPDTLTVDGGQSSPIGSGFNGIVIDNSLSQLITTGTGAITLNGIGSSRGILLNNRTKLVTDSGAITLTGKSDPGGFGILVTNGASVESTNGNITLAADEINIFGPSQFKGNGTISLQPFTPNLGITVGGTFTTDDLNIDDSELATLQNGFSEIIIASPDNTGTITIDNAATFNAPVNITGGSTLIGPNRDTTWTITGSNSVSLSGYPNRLTASNIQNLKGGTLNDDFVFNNGQNWGGKIDGDAGIDSLSYSAFTTPVIVDLATLGATGIETVIGTNNATSTLIGTNTNNTWNLTGTNSGKLNDTLNFSNFQNLAGGTLDDNFVFNDGVTWEGKIDGNNGIDVLDYSAFTTDLTVDLAALNATGIETAIGTANATSALIGENKNNNWNLTGTNSGKLNDTLNFIQFQNILGGNTDDNFVFGDGINWSGSIDGKSGIDTLDYSNFTSSITIDIGTLNVINIETIIGTNNATSNLIAENINNIWEISGSDSGRLNDRLNFQNFQRLTGGNLDDSFIFANGVNWGGIIDGNAGINTLDYSAYTTPLTVDLATLENFALNINNMLGTTNANSTLIAKNESNVWAITGNNSGTVNTNLNFSNFQQLVGGNVDDEFVFNDGINWNGTIDGRDGKDTLNYANFTSNLIVDLETMKPISIENIIGTNKANSTLIARNTTNTWNLIGNNSGSYNNTLNFSQFQNLTGNNGTDIFIFDTAASISGNINGGAGILMLIGDEINFSGAVYGTGNLRIEALNNNQNIQVGGTDSGSNTVLDLTSTELSLLQNGFSSITIGGTAENGTITLAGDATFQDPVKLQTLGVITHTNGILRGADNATITLAAKGDITTGSIINPGRQISIASQQGKINTKAGIIDASSVTGDGGAIDLTTSGNISTRNINSNSTATKGGNIALTSETGNIIANNLNSSGINSGGNIVVQAETAITTGDINASATIGNAGNVTLDPIGDIEVNFINAEGGTSGKGGDVFIESTGGFFRANNSFTSSFSPTGTASISTAGGVGGGSITIRHAGGDETSPIQPFVIGSSTLNGTQAAITTGSFTLFPNESFPRSFNLGNINLVTDNGIIITPPQTQPQLPSPSETQSQLPQTEAQSPPQSSQTEAQPLLQPQSQTETPLQPETTPAETRSPTESPPQIATQLPPEIPSTETQNQIESPPQIATQLPPEIPSTETQNQIESPPQTSAQSPPEILPTETRSPIQSPPEPQQQTQSLPQSENSLQLEDPKLFIAQQNPLIQSPIRDSIPVTIDASIFTIEASLTREFESYFGQPPDTPIATVSTIQERLRQTEQETGVRSALVYMVFSRQNLGVNASLICPLAQESLQREENRELQQSACDRSPEDPLELLLVTGNTQPKHLLIPTAKRQQVLALVTKMRAEIANPYKTHTNSYLAASQQLYNILIAPIQPELQAEKIKNLVFVPDAGLRSLPFAALHDGQKFLIEQYSLALIPSFSLSQPQYINLKKARVLGMGASQFREQTPLPFVPLELETVTSKLGQGRFFLNESFTINNLKIQRTQQSFEIVHLATHAEFQTGLPNNSYIQLWDTRLQLPQMQQLNWKTPPVELLVLSACRTALGDKQAELGFAGLGVQAGVRSALASLWYANDKGTLGLMAIFYQHLQQAPIRAEALRQAQIALIGGQVKIEGGKLRLSPEGAAVSLPNFAETADTNFSHPYYWAAFALIGNPW